MKILDWNVCRDMTEEKKRHLEKLQSKFVADILILQECKPEGFDLLKNDWKYSLMYSDTLYEHKEAFGVAIFSNEYEIRFTQNFNRNFRYVIPLEVWKDNKFQFYLFAVWTKSKPINLYKNFLEALEFEGYKDYISEPALFIGDFNTPTTQENDKAYKTIISKGLINCATPGEEYKETYSHKTEDDFYTADYCFASEKMAKDNKIKVTIHDFDKTISTKLKYQNLSDHVPLEITINTINNASEN